MAEPSYRIKVIGAVFPNQIWASFSRVFPPREDRNWVIDTPLGKETYERETWRSEEGSGSLTTDLKGLSHHFWGEF